VACNFKISRYVARGVKKVGQHWYGQILVKISIAGLWETVFKTTAIAVYWICGGRKWRICLWKCMLFVKFILN